MTALNIKIIMFIISAINVGLGFHISKNEDNEQPTTAPLIVLLLIQVMLCVYVWKI